MIDELNSHIICVTTAVQNKNVGYYVLELMSAIDEYNAKRTTELLSERNFPKGPEYSESEIMRITLQVTTTVVFMKLMAKRYLIEKKMLMEFFAELDKNYSVASINLHAMMAEDEKAGRSRSAQQNPFR